MHVVDLGLIPLSVASFLWEVSDRPGKGFVGSLVFEGNSRQESGGLNFLHACVACP